MAVYCEGGDMFYDFLLFIAFYYKTVFWNWCCENFNVSFSCFLSFSGCVSSM